MRHTTFRALTAAVLTLIAGAGPAYAQSTSTAGSRCGEPASFTQLFTGTVDGFKQLKSRESLAILTIGGAAAAATHPADKEVTEDFTHGGALRKTFKSGTYIGGTPLQLASAFAVYGLGRALHHSCAANLGADLVSAQLMAQAMTIGIKVTAQRERPDGNGYSFPSGHTAMAFASATVLQKHYGWKVGIPAYAVASYVGISRVQTDRHYASDVVFGAALGLVAGRSVTFGSERFVIGPTGSPRSAGVSLTWAGRK